MAWDIVYQDAVTGVLSWNSVGADTYDVGWDTVSKSGGDVNDPTLYPNRLSVGSALSWTNNTGGPVFAAVRSVLAGELGPWSTEKSLSA